MQRPNVKGYKGRKMSNLISHFFRRCLGSEPMPGVGFQRVSVASDGEHDDSVGRYGAGSPGAAGGGQFLEGGRDVHRLGVDEGEEENVGSGLLVVKEFWFKVGVQGKVLQEKVNPHNLKESKEYFSFTKITFFGRNRSPLLDGMGSGMTSLLL